MKIQLKTLDIEAQGTNIRIYRVHSPKPRNDAYCLRLNFDVSKLGY